LEQDEIIIDGALLARTFRRQLRGWLWKGPLVFGALLLLALLLVPRTYTTSVSVAMQQPTPTGGLAGLLGGGGSGNKHYIGVLKSREMALQVERRVHLQQVYGLKTLPTEAAAAALLAKGIKPEDNPDGLLYLTITLPGSPRISLTPAPRPAQVEAAAAQAADAYALALKNYFVTSDNDQGVVLLRGADAEVRRARDNYDDALAQVLEFNRSLGRVDPRSAPTSSSDTTDAATAASGLGGLYTSLYQVQGDLKAALAARQTSAQQLTGQLNNLPEVPTDDPLLAEARGKVSQDQADYQAASRLYGPENPSVIRAKTRLDVDQADLDRQIQGVRQNLTTSNARTEAQIQSLYAHQASLVKQIASAEHHLGIHRQLSGELGRLQTEVGFQADILRATLTQAQNIKLNTASAQSRMSVIDRALPPTSGEPATMRLALLCLLPVLLAFVMAVVLDYLRGARAARAGDKAVGAAPSAPANGSGAKPLGENGSGAKPVGESGDAAPFVTKR